MSMEKELALIDIGYACFAIPKFRGEKEDFTGWLSKVERVFACCILNDQEKFKVVISRLRGYALEWWERYKYKRKKRGKSKIKTWDKLRGKLEYAFAPTSYLHKHLFRPFEGNDLNSSSKDIPFNKGSPMSACIPNPTPFLCLETPNPNKDEKILGEEVTSLINPPPKFDELEVEEPQVSDFEPCEVIDEIEELLCQEEFPHLQQELRTILFEERGYDVHFQGCHFHSSSSTSWEASSKQIHAWQGPSSVPLFEFHDKRHFMEFYLNFKVPYPKMMGAIKDQALGEQPSSLHIYSSSTEVKNIHILVRNTMEQSDSRWVDSTRNFPGLVTLFGPATEGGISCTHHPLKA